jgi:phosphate starvation-inducible PhoH-like protein|tara:strand:+ start:4507 stop:5199 length:693 start_codon:yes stop_codon:yes gene_type:complete
MSRRSETNPIHIKIDQLRVFDPLTPHQKEAFDAWKQGNHLILSGSAGTGKTFIALYLALQESLDKSTPYEEVRIIRSIVPTRDIGHLPGTAEEKLQAYAGPYKGVVSQLFERSDAYDTLVQQRDIAFESTSYLRGVTFDNSIVIVDELQNLNFHELDSVITRIGNNSKIIFCGDYYQTDFKREGEKKECLEFIDIVEQLRNFSHIEFTWDDIVRSDFVRDYIMTKEMRRA